MASIPPKFEGFRIVSILKDGRESFIAERDGLTAEVAYESPEPMSDEIRAAMEDLAVEHWHALRNLERAAAREEARTGGRFHPGR